MANETIRARIEVLLKGMDQVESLKNAVRQLQTTASPAAADLQKLKNAALQLGGAADRSENDLRRSINALKDVRAQLSMTDAEYRKLTSTINKYQAQLDRATGAQQRGGRAMQFAQTAGAVAASGVFGGPEGLAGAAIGGVLGGSAGALAGGAVGAQVSMFRQQIAATTDYAAQIEKLRIATKGVVGDQQSYERALAAAADVTNRLNVPLLESTQGMTKLSASIIGAGGKVTDAELVFKNVAAAIKATGGGAEEVQGSLLAMSQIFSKGKVSAEELQGQLGERLPGAVTMFAEATGRSLPQLQKDLEQGVVGLNDVMKFVIALGDRYTATAEKISKSDADAGARFARDIKNFQQQFGAALLPVGAQIQDSFGELLRNVGPTLISTAKQIALAFKAIVDNAEIIGNIARLALQFGALTLAVKAFVALRPGIAAVFLTLQTGGAQAAAAAALATPKVLALRTAIAGLLKLGIVTIVIDVLVRGIGKIVELRQQIKELRDYDPAADYAGKTREEVQSAVGEAKKSLSKAQKDLAEYNSKEWARFWVPGARLFLGGVTDKKLIEVQIAKAQKTINQLDPLKFPTQAELAKKELEDLQKQLSKFADPTDAGGGKEKADKAKKDAERLAAEQQRLNEAAARAEIDLQNAVHRNAMELIRKRHEYQRELQDIELENWVKGFTGAGRSAAGMIAGYLKQIDGLRTRALDAELSVQNAQQQRISAQSMASVTGGGAPVSSSGVIARTGNTGDSTGPHLDLRWGDGRPISKADADKYFLVNGKAPSSFGVTSPYGPRNLFGRSFHHGIDFGTPAGSALSLRGGATLGRNLGNTGAGGYAVEVMTPEGTMRALHLMANSVVRGGSSTATGVAAQQRRAVTAAGRAGAEDIDLQSAQQAMEMTQQHLTRLREAIGTGFVADFTSQIREQISAIEDQNFQLDYRNKLEQSGMKPAFVEAMIKKSDAARELTSQISVANQALETLEKNGEGNSVQAERLRAAIEALVLLYPQLSKAIDENAKKQAAAAAKSDKFGTRFRETLQDAYKSATDLGGQLGGVVVSGIDGLSNALAELATTGKANFKEMAASILKDLGAIFIRYALFKALFGAFPGLSIGMAATGGATGPNSAAPLKKFANGGVMSNNVVPLKRYAAGGIAREPQMALYGERGPEAYVPLPDGRSIPVKMQQRNDALNRYKPIGAIGTMAGDNENGGMQQAGAPMSGAIDVRYTVERINNVEYVTAEQFRQGMREAAARGAAQGEQRTLRRLQTSVSTRKRIGV